MAYTPLQPNQAPALNTSGDAVRTLQQQLNTQNQGVAGYVPLKVDGLYGPLTQAATTFKPAGAPAGTGTTPPKIGDLVNTGTPIMTPEQIAAEKEYADYYNAPQPVDEEAIRRNTLASFQAEIDATNTLYANKLAEAKIAGQGRLGSDTAIQGRRGLIGSDFGASRTADVNTGNQNIYDSIEAEKAAKISSILGKSRDTASAAIADKRAAYEQGLDKSMQYFKEAGTRKKTNASEAAKLIYGQNLDPKDITPAQLSEIAKNYGIAAEDINAAYLEIKKAGDEEKAKKEIDATKALPASAQEYEYAKKNGYKGSYNQYQNEDANRKARALGVTPETKPFFSGSASFTPQQITSFSSALESSKGQDGYVDPAAYQEAYSAWVQSGALSKDFLTKFPPKQYVNPVNNTLPAYLRSATTTTGRSA